MLMHSTASPGVVEQWNHTERIPNQEVGYTNLMHQFHMKIVFVMKEMLVRAFHG